MRDADRRRLVDARAFALSAHRDPTRKGATVEALRGFVARAGAPEAS